jgi:tRNA-specific 2-thiouridylase
MVYNSKKQKPDKNKKVLVAMTGRVSSMVAAYLLKKQGLNPIGIGIEFFKEEEPFEYDNSFFPGVSKQGFETSGLSRPLRNHYHIENIEAVKEIADRLEIPFYGVSAQEHYYDKVQDPFVASRMSGRLFTPSLHVTRLIIEILQEKAAKLGADWVATGHYAKVLHSSDGKTSSIYVSNGLEEDQSAQFGYLKQSHLGNLILPLSEMRHSETLKIAQLIGVKEDTKTELKADTEFVEDPRVPSLVNRYSPFSLREEGDIYHYFNDIILGDHDGIQLFYPGKEKLSTRMTPIMDTSLSVVKIYPGFRRVVVADKTKINYTHVCCRKFNGASDIDVSRPISGFVKLPGEEEKVGCTLYFKNNGYVVFRFAKQREGILYTGSNLSFYSKKSLGGKLVGSAEVFSSTEFVRDSFRDMPSRDPELDKIQAEKDAENVNPYETKYSDTRHHF